jgi:hypothetical protein
MNLGRPARGAAGGAGAESALAQPFCLTAQARLGRVVQILGGAGVTEVLGSDPAAQRLHLAGAFGVLGAHARQP